METATTRDNVSSTKSDQNSDESSGGAGDESEDFERGEITPGYIPAKEAGACKVLPAVEAVGFFIITILTPVILTLVHKFIDDPSGALVTVSSNAAGNHLEVSIHAHTLYASRSS